MLKKKIYRRLLSVSCLILSFLSTSSNILALESSNFDIIQNELKKASQSISEQLKKIDADTIYTNLKTMESDRFFNSIILKSADSNGILVYIDEITNGTAPFLDIKTNIKTSYSTYENDRDSLLRKIDIIYSGAIKTIEGRLIPINVTNFSFEDIISRDNAVLHNDTEFDFAKNSIPEKPGTFWDDIVQPITIIGAAVVTVVLLFTLRSN